MTQKNAYKPEIRRASMEDIEAFAKTEARPTTVAWAAVIEDRVIALFGFALVKGRWLAFCDVSEEARKYKLTIVKSGKMIFEEARKMGIKFIYADADLMEPRSVKWLESLGFELDPRSRKFYRWQNVGS